MPILLLDEIRILAICFLKERQILILFFLCVTIVAEYVIIKPQFYPKLFR